MCGSNHARFSQAETKYFVGATEIPRNQIREEHGRDGSRNTFAKKQTKFFAGMREYSEKQVTHLPLNEFALKFPNRKWFLVQGFGNKRFSVDNPGPHRGALVSWETDWRPIDRVVNFSKTPQPSVCDARCRNATGMDCDCSCGGSQHGVNVAMSRARFAAEDLDLRPTAEMAANAERGLALREEHGKGGTAVGVARARDIKNRANLSPDTVKRMHSFFSRHEGNQKGGEDDAGYIAWLLWGGDAGKAWAARKAAQINKDTNMKNARKAGFALDDIGSRERLKESIQRHQFYTDRIRRAQAEFRVAFREDFGINADPEVIRDLNAVVDRAIADSQRNPKKAAADLRAWADGITSMWMHHDHGKRTALAARQIAMQMANLASSGFARKATPNKDRFSMDMQSKLMDLTRRFGFKPSRVIVRGTHGTILFEDQPGEATRYKQKLAPVMKAMGIPDSAIKAREVSYPEEDGEPATHTGVVEIDYAVLANVKASRPGAKAAFSVDSRIEVLRQKVQTYIAKGGSWQGLDKPEGLAKLVGDIINGSFRPTDTGMDNVESRLRKYHGMNFSRTGAKSAFAVKKSVGGQLVTLVKDAKGADWVSYWADWSSPTDVRVKRHGKLVEYTDGRVVLRDTAGNIVSEGRAGYGSMSPIRASRTGAKSAFAANNVDLWNYFARSDFIMVKQNPTELANYERFAKKALSMADFTPPARQGDGPSLHQMAKEALADIAKYKETVYRHKNRAPWDTYARPGAKAAFAHPSWHEGILGKDTAPALAAYSWIDRSNVPVQGRTQTLLADLAAGVHATSPNLSIEQAVLAAAKDMVRKGVATGDLREWAANGGKFSRPGASEAFALGRVSTAATPQADEALTALAAKVGREHTVSLFKRWAEGKAAMSRGDGKASFSGGNYYTVAAHIASDPAGERNFQDLAEAKAYAKVMLDAAKSRAKGKPVVVDVYPVVNYSPQAAVMTLKA